MNYYEILEVQESASMEEIKQNYKKLALIHHPDKHSCKSKEEQEQNMEKFKKITEAFEILSDPCKRNQYNQKKNQNYSVNGFDLHNPFDIFHQMFGSGHDTHCNRQFMRDPFMGMTMPSFGNFANDPFFDMHTSIFSNMSTNSRSQFCRSSFTSTSRRETMINGRRKILTTRRDEQGNIEEIEEIYEGRRNAKSIRKNGKIVCQSGDMRLLT
eukprot:NODE_599_length_5524_cov_0.451060.p3 type:complete len:212 gc:universal NODE_599_length_5524_cov_0.451060:444-1079(+)